MLGGCRNGNITRSICMHASIFMEHVCLWIRVRTEVMGTTVYMYMYTVVPAEGKGCTYH